MSSFCRLNSRLVKFTLSFSVLAPAALFVPNAMAQLPAVVPYGTRIAFTLPSGMSSTTPGKVTRDAAGNIFVLVPAVPAIVELPVNGPIQVVVPSTDASIAGLTGNVALTADAAGNLYVSKVSSSLGITKIPRLANGTYNYAGETTNSVLNSAALTNNFYSPADIAVDSIGNIYVASKGGNTVGSWTGTGILMVGPSAPNGRYLVTTAVALASIAVDAAGDVFYTDKTNAWELTAATIATANATPVQIGMTTGTVCSTCTAITTPNTIFLDNANNVYVGNNSSNFVVLPYSGSAYSTSSPTYLLPTTVVGHSGYNYGTVDNSGNFIANFGTAIEFYGGGKVYYANSSTYFLGNPVATGVASSTSVPSGATVGFLFTQAVTLGTTGTPAEPYAIVNAGSANGAAGPAQTSLNTGSTNTTCTAGGSYTAGQTCTVELGYAGRQPGALTGALVMYSSTGSILASVNLSDIVTGPALALDSVLPTTIGTGYAAPAGLAIDTTGAVYVADPLSNSVLKYAAGSTAAGTAFGTGLSSPSGVAMDAAGNLYIADTGNNRVVVIPNYLSGLSAGNQVALSTGSYTLSGPRGIAVDSFGNIFVADTGNARILELPNPFSGGAGTIPTLIASGLTSPYGIAFDAYNNLFVADKGANAVYEILGAFLTSTPSATVNSVPGALIAVGTGFSAPTGVAADASGSVYVADGGNGRIVKVPSESGVLTTADQAVLYTGLNKPFGIATDLTNDIFYTDQAAPGVYFAQRSSPNSGKTGFLNFGSVAVNSTTNITSTVSNAGLTTSLAISAIASPAAPVSLGSASTNPCSATPTLLPGKGCNLLLTYNPTATGSTSAFFNVTDNALNGTAVVQGIHYEGVVSGAVATVTLTGPTSVAYGDTATFTLTALDSSGNPAVAGNGTYTVNITGTATKTASVTLSGGTGTFFLPALNVGSYTLATTVSSIAATASAAVTKAPLMLTANSFTRIFDQANPALSFTYSGFGNGDTSASLTGTAPTVSTTATRVSNAGNYPVSLTGGTLSSSNYTITLANGTATIGGATPQAIIFPPLPPYTHGTSVTLTGQATSGLPLSYTVTAGSATVSGAVLTITAAGTVTVQAAQAGNGNYAAAPVVVRSFTAQ